jgi:transposase-like protein
LGLATREEEDGVVGQGGRKEQANPAELERMSKELAKVEMDRDILRKALGSFAADISFPTLLLPNIAVYGEHERCVAS